MKYPQLVSTRAVNAISDWLVSRLEQLGVEAPQIYARFLLSLLQSSVQINDPIEYSNLETFIASREGNTRRLHQLLGDTDTLKKLTAVQCLQGIVSPDQEISKIEGLVEELCTKLQEFEQQNAEASEDAALLLTSEQEKQQEQELLKEQRGKKAVAINLNTRAFVKNRIRVDIEEDIKQAQAVHAIDKKSGLEKSEVETDPKKRYFSAFPALSKGMDEESFRALRLNAKSLTWPVERKQSEQSEKSAVAQVTQNLSDSSNSSIYQTAGTGSAGEQKLKQESSESAPIKSTTKVRRRSRRRRNQALKTKSMEQKSNSKSKTTTKTVGEAEAKAEAAAVKVEVVTSNTHKGKRKERYSTPANWDTDFEGCWEMGRDLIQEFIKKQNYRNERNRSTSESAAYEIKSVSGGEKNQEMTPSELDLEYYYGNAAKGMVADKNDKMAVDYALASVAELTLNLGAREPRRLYERDTAKGKLSVEKKTEDDFEQFKAKFNSSVEALWKDAEPVQPIAEKSEVSHAKLKSFWSHYFQDQTLAPTADVKPATNMGIGSMSLKTQAAEYVTNTSDYYSMPNTWDEVDKAGSRKTPVGVFLNTNSIWSEQPKSTNAANNEDNFFYKVWNANQTLTQLDTNQENKLTHEKSVAKTYLKPGDGYAPFNMPKWSENINAAPTVTNAYSLQSNNFGFIDCPDSSTTDSASASTTSCSSSMYPWPHHAWQTTGFIGQQPQNTVMSLTDMYARDTLEHTNTCCTANSQQNSPAVETMVANGPKVTLTNHAFNGNSAFVEYARIKPFVKKTNSYAAATLRKPYANPMDLICNSNENLLTSELTHFQPIRTYRDGHVFNICSAWDTVHYERSGDGYLCLGADKYLEYKRNDNYAAEDDAALAARSGNASTAPLYATSNCDAATSMRQRKQLEVAKKPFVLKFRVIDNCEVGCQTEDPTATKARLNALSMTQQQPSAALFAGGARTGMYPRTLPNTGVACSDALESLNKAIATAAKTRVQQPPQQQQQVATTTYAYNNNNTNNNLNYQNFNRNDDLLLMTVDQHEVDWLPATKVAQHVAAGVKNELYKAKSAADLWPVYHVQKATEIVEKAPIKDEMNKQIVVVDNEASYCDEVDYCLSGKKSPWSMRAIGKKCQQNEQIKRKRLKNNSNNNNGSADDEDDDDIDADDEHTLWGMCAACHTDNKALSLPANRLLRDELNQEADEIMNELKNMQDLYICRDATDDDENEIDHDDDDDDDEEIENDEITVQMEQQQIISNWCNYSPFIVQQQQQQHKIKDKNMNVTENPNKVLLQMNRFIEDWLRPAALQGEKYDIWYTDKAKKSVDETHVGQSEIQSIWQIKDDSSAIEMQMEAKDTKEVEESVKRRGIAVADAWKPLDLLLQLNAADAPTQQSRDDSFLSNLSWEHENLAAIWNNSTPLPTVKYIDENENNINDYEVKQNERESATNYVNDKQPSERVKAFLQHLGVLNYKREKSASTTNAYNTPKLALATAIITANRKRRHSESLKLAKASMKAKYGILDDKLIELFGNDGICCKKTTKIVDTNLANDYGNVKNNNAHGNDNDVGNLVVGGEYGFNVQQREQQQQQQQKTIITCKYWATAAANSNKSNMKNFENIDIDINDELNSSFAIVPEDVNCQFDKNNASILRHVTTAMITRPLTR